METQFLDLLGKTIAAIEVNEHKDVIKIACADGSLYEMYHDQDCCESVMIEDIDGDLEDLIGSPVLLAEKITSDKPFNGKPENPESFTWTFYKLATIKGYVTLRWLGESNGYYSESVNFTKVR